MHGADEDLAKQGLKQDRERDALDGYHERRLEKIRRRVPLDEDKLITLEELRGLADGPASARRTPRPR